jgi:ribonuclease P protein component
MNTTFPKSERLCSKVGIEELFASGNTHRSGVFTVRYMRSHTDEGVESAPLDSQTPLPKILVSVPRRIQKRAVDRNRTKRLIREVYRKHKAEYLSYKNIHSLAIIYASPKVPDYAFVEEHLPQILEDIR